jgi:phosphoribosylanthranilate isomerase
MKSEERLYVRIKLCGITRLDDALVAVASGVDALGFIFYKKSARNIDPEDARIIIEQLPPFVDVVGVFVDRKRSEVEEIIRYCGLNYAQLHGEESVKYCDRLSRAASPCRVIKAFRVKPELTAEDIAPYAPFIRAYLLDAYVAGEKGGTGKTFDWSMVEKLKIDRPYILAGGLSADNVCNALAALNPYAIDFSSSVEKAPGVKKHGQIRAFVKLVRQ